MSPSPHLRHEHDARDLRAQVAVLTLSDTRTPETDLSGRRIRELLETAGHVVADYALIRDEPADLKSRLTAWLSPESGIDTVITNGGTGVSRRDQTIPIVEEQIALRLPGFGELFRTLSYHQIGSAAMLSRAAAGISSSGKLLVALPGSTAAVELAMTQLLLPQLGHLISELRK